MHDDAAFIRAICESPGYDLPRLVYADYLEETGRAERAEFIRLQIEIAAGDSLCDRCENPTLTARCRGGRCQLLRRERAYLDRHKYEMTKVVLAAAFARFKSEIQRQATDPNYRVPPRTTQGLLAPSHDSWMFARGVVTYKRGFASKIRLPLFAFTGEDCIYCGSDGIALRFPTDSGRCHRCNGTSVGRIKDHAALLFAANPIVSVVLTDRVPTRSIYPDRWGWIEGFPASSGGVSGDLWTPELGQDFRSEALALAALNQRAVAYGRSLAGLSTLQHAGAA